MIKATITESGMKMNQVVQYLKDAEMELYGYIERVALLSRVFINERMEVHLGASAEHFRVMIRPNSFHGWTIMVHPADEIGRAHV